jgi:alkylated DNA repair protein (DNA oxidative demethylase)
VVIRTLLAPGILLWRDYFDRPAQTRLLEQVLRLTEQAPFYRPAMPGSGKDFSVEQTNFGELGWVSDKSGYRYQTTHPQTGAAWPPIPDMLLSLWTAVTQAGTPPPQCCLVNRYRGTARMGLHQDLDERADVPVVSVSLGDAALFRIGGQSRRAPTRGIKLFSGDVLSFGGPARRMFHGIDRLMAASSTLVPGGGRINLTLRRVDEGEE